MDTTRPLALEKVKRIDFATQKSYSICENALSVFDDLRKGNIEVAIAGELSNALGKANGAIRHILKAEELEQDAFSSSVKPE